LRPRHENQPKDGDQNHHSQEGGWQENRAKPI
jgi:hypothetical protein